jgi:hypothetical protein
LWSPPSAAGWRAKVQRWKNMPAAMMAMTCQASQIPAGTSRRHIIAIDAAPPSGHSSSADTAKVATRPANPATRAPARPEARRPSTSSNGSSASVVVMGFGETLGAATVSDSHRLSRG